MNKLNSSKSVYKSWFNSIWNRLRSSSYSTRSAILSYLLPLLATPCIVALNLLKSQSLRGFIVSTARERADVVRWAKLTIRINSQFPKRRTEANSKGNSLLGAQFLMLLRALVLNQCTAMALISLQMTLWCSWILHQWTTRNLLSSLFKLWVASQSS